MSPRVGIVYNMDVKVFCVLFIGLFLEMCSAVSIPSDSPAACRGYCEIFSDICKNGGTCVESAPCSTSGSCICPDNYSGEHCQKLKHPGETAEQKAQPKPRVKNNLLLSLFRSLAGSNFGEKSQNHKINSKPSEDHKDDRDTVAKQEQVKQTPKPIAATSSSTTARTTTSTTTSTSTTTTTEPTTTTRTTSTPTTTSQKTTTQKPKESTTVTTPVTTEISSQEVTSVSELSTIEDRLNAVSEETTTDEIPTSTELSKELDMKQTSSDVTVGDSPVLTNDVMLQSSLNKVIIITTPLPTVYVDDQDKLSLSPSIPLITVTGGHDAATYVLTEQATSERQSTNKQIGVGNPVINQGPGLKEEAKKVEPATGELVKPAKASEPQLMNEKQPFVEKVSDNLDIQMLLQNVTKKNINQASNSVKEPDTSSTSSSKEQITTPSALVTSLLENLLKTPHSKNKNSERVDKGTQTMHSMEKAVRKMLQDGAKDMSSAMITSPQKASTVSSSTSVQILSASKKDGKSDDKTNNLNKKIKNGTDSLSEMETIIYNKIMKGITNSLKHIIKSAVSKSDSTTMAIPEKDDAQMNFDHIIPDTVNNVNQMDQHLHSKSSLVNNVDTHLASSAPVKPTSTIDIHPTVEGQPLPDSQTDSAQDILSRTASNKQ